MAKNISKDMTQGPPLKLILAFFVPLMMGMLFQQFYSMMDTEVWKVSGSTCTGSGWFYGVH